MSSNEPVSPRAPPPRSGVAAGTTRLARNALVPLAARVFDLGFALVYLRFLDESGTGAYQFLVALTTYLDTLVDFGLNTLAARDVARAPHLAGAMLRAVSLLRLGLWLLGLPLVFTAYGPARETFNLPPQAAVAGWLFYLALLPSILAKGATGLLWAFERLEITGAVSVVSTLLKTALGSIALFSGAGLIGLSLSSLAVNLASAGLLTLAVRGSLRAQSVPGRDGTDSIRTTVLVRESWPLFVNQLLQGLFFKVDAILLPALAGTAQAGAYAAAYKVNEGAGTISSSLTLALFPSLARQAEAGSGQFANSYRRATRLLLAISLPLAVGSALLADPIMSVVGGRSFLPDAAIALTLLIWYLPFSYVNGLTQYVLIAAGRQRFLTVAFFLAFAFNVAANAAAIPRFGYAGAAVVTVLSELVLIVPFQWAVRREVPGVSLWRAARVPLLSAGLMAGPVWWAGQSTSAVFATVVGLAVYLLGLWAFGGIEAEDWSALRRLLPMLPNVPT